MILVTLGTQDKSFKRLLKAIDNEIKNKNIKEKVIVQAGYTKYKTDNMEIFDYCSSEELDKLMKDAKLIITHGGVGSILGALKYDKPVMAISLELESIAVNKDEFFSLLIKKLIINATQKPNEDNKFIKRPK